MYSLLRLHASFGIDCSKRYNLHYIDFGVVLFSAGNTVQTLDVFSGAKTVIFGRGAVSSTRHNNPLHCLTFDLYLHA